jgi:hypothetical protein
MPIGACVYLVRCRLQLKVLAAHDPHRGNQQIQAALVDERVDDQLLGH